MVSGGRGRIQLCPGVTAGLLSMSSASPKATNQQGSTGRDLCLHLGGRVRAQTRLLPFLLPSNTKCFSPNSCPVPLSSHPTVATSAVMDFTSPLRSFRTHFSWSQTKGGEGGREEVCLICILSCIGTGGLGTVRKSWI